MTITIAFVSVVATILAVGSLHRRWDAARHLRFADGDGSDRAILPLARFEARKVLTHPTWLITLGLTSALVTTLLVMEVSGSVPNDGPVTWFALVGVMSAAPALVVSMHRIGTRDRRHATEELVAATPTSPRARTSALLISCVAPVPVLVLAMVVATIVSQISYALLPDPGLSNSFEFVTVLLAGVGAGVVGIFLSRWLPFAVAPLLGIVALIWLNNGVDHLHPRFRWLRVLVEADYGGRFDVRPLGWSAIFIGGLIVLGACLALWRHPPHAGLVGATVVAIAVVASVGWVMTRTPSDAQVAARVDLLENPTGHQHCESRGNVSYCVYPGAEEWIESWDPAVRAVVDQLPAAARPATIEVVQRTAVGTRSYLPEVRVAVDPARAWPADGRIHPPMSLEDERTPDLTVAWQTAALAIGLPPATSWQRPAGCMAGGQARIVLAHVLAGRATITTREGLVRKAGDVQADSRHAAPIPMDLEYDYDSETAQPLGAEVTPGDQIAADGLSTREYFAIAGASGWGTDVLAAKLLMDGDRAKVDSVIATNWSELVDPATPTSRLLELADIEAAELLMAMPNVTKTTEAAACP